MGWESAAAARVAQARHPTPTAAMTVFFPAMNESPAGPRRRRQRATVLVRWSAVLRARRVQGDRRRWAAAWVSAVLASLVVLWGASVQARDPRGSSVERPGPAVAAGPCRERLLGELRRGEVSEGPGCEVERQMAQRRQHQLARWGFGFGLLERATPGLGEVLLLVSEGRGCAMWPLRQPGHASLGLYEIKKAGCWVRRYNGPLAIAGVLPDGRKLPAIAVVPVREGRARVDLTRLAMDLDRRGLAGLDAFVRLELGVDGWAGDVDLVAMRASLADNHAAAVQRGRGVAALLPIRHPDHPAADQIRALALTTTLERQDADFKAVERGELSPHRFLERHAWSPYRRLVAAMAGVP